MGLISKEYITEFRNIVILACPIILMNLFRFLNPFFSVVICGHLSQLEFAAASLANSIINVFGVAIDLGFSTGCDTLFSQIYGSKSRHKLGLMLQRAMVVMSIVYVLLCYVHLNVEPILIWLQQDVQVARLTSRYVAIYLPGLFFDFQFLTISRYLQNQNIVYPMMISALTGAIFNGVSQYIAIYVLKYSIDASALLQGVSCFIMFLVQLLYVLISKVYQDTWQGVEVYKSCESWSIFFKLGLPGIIMLGVEEWSFEIGNFIAGSISAVQLAAQGIAFNLSFWFFTVHIGTSIAGAIRCGQFLGSNEPYKARVTARTVLFTDCLFSITLALIIASLRTYLPYIFTQDEEIRKIAERIMVILIFVEAINGGYTSSAGIYRACGRQLKGAIVMTISYYCIGIPIGVVFVFVVGMDIVGFWLGLLIGLLVEVIVYLFLLFTINWPLEAERALRNEKDSKLTTEFESVIDSAEEKHDYEDEDESDFEVDEISESKSLLRDSMHITDNNSAHRFPRSNAKISKMKISMLHIRSLSGAEDLISTHLLKQRNLLNNPVKDPYLIMKKSLLILILILGLIGAILLKFYLPPSAYIPCLDYSTFNGTNPKHYPFCNNTSYY